MGQQNDDEGSRIVPDCGQGKLHPPKRVILKTAVDRSSRIANAA
jgi:hypothetical protein